MIIGYARTSKREQNLDSQIDAIKDYADRLGLAYTIYSEQVSGRAKRKELENALKAVQPGNKFVVYQLFRMARSTKELIDITDKLTEKGVEFVSLTDNIDTSTASGKAMFGMLAVYGEFERNIIQERTQAGLTAAKKRGRLGGRPPINEAKKKVIRQEFASGKSAVDIAKEYGIGRSTVYKIVKEKER